MKFANLYYERKGRLTIGDDIQMLAIENLYHYMNIDYNSVVRVGYHELSEYNGEYVILPISFPFYGYQHDVAITQFSPKIIPVFLGLSFMSSNISEEDLMYLRKYSPIGCRDQHTLDILRNNNVVSYLNGCMTASFPRKRFVNDNSLKKIFCIDVPESFKKFIPQELLSQCEFVSHTYYYSEIFGNTEDEARKKYQIYVDEAKLIVTTRLHGALPNVAAGIPVIFIKDKLSFRFMGIDKLIKIYEEDEYKNIDWNPKPIEYEKEKQMFLEIAKKRIFDVYNMYEGIYTISSFYESKEKNPYYIEFVDNTIEFIDRYWSKTEEIQYALWGVTQTAEMIHHYVKVHYPKAKLVAVIDKNKRLKFCGVETCESSWLEINTGVFVFVCTGAAIKESYQLFNKYGMKNFYQCCEDGQIHKMETAYRNDL